MQGYLTVALDQDKYVDMAVNLARSLRHFDNKRPICLVYNDNVSLGADARSAFTHFVNLPSRDGYLGCMNKIRLDGASPFDETMYIDSDCLLVKGDIDRHWNQMSQGFFSMTGDKRRTGHWNKLDIAKACEMFSITYVVQMNSGVFYFKKGDETSRFFNRLRDLYDKHRDFLSNIHQGRKGQYADEPFFGIAMGEFKIAPLAGTPEEGSLMVTTWRAKNCDFRPEKEFSRIDKPASYWFGTGLLPKRWVTHSPTIAHFIGLKPKELYERTADYFRKASEKRTSVAAANGL